jgi:undecaprenyl-diphosphatase
VRRSVPLWIAAAGAAAVFVALWLDVSAGGLLARSDPGTLHAMISLHASWFTPVMVAASLIGNTLPMTGLTLLIGGWLAMSRRLDEALTVVVAMGLANLAFVPILKAAVGRARPSSTLALIPTPTDGSFPSGHATASFMLLALVAALVGPRVASWGARAALALACALGTGLVGVSRVYLGVHWPTDVLAGWSLGAALAAASLALLATWRERSRPLGG